MERHEYSPWNLFTESLQKYRDHVLLIHNNHEYTYGQINDKILEIAKSLENRDFTIGGVFLPNGAEFITAMLAMNKLKKVFVSLSYQFKGDTLIELMNFTDIELLITNEKGYLSIQGYIDRLNIRTVMVMQNNGDFIVYEFPDKPKRELPGIHENTFCICFTSGSTSRPKGIMLSNFAITGNALAVAEHLGFTSRDRTIIPRSLAQASPISGDILMAISRGGGIILLNNVFHPAIFLKAIQDYKATTVYIVRTMLIQVLEYPQFKDYDVHTLKRLLIGGMINPLKIYQEAAKKFPKATLYNAYGASETSARISFGEHADVTSLPCVIGKPIRGCKINIYREDGLEAACGEMGQVYVESDYVMDGYYKSEQLTREVFTSKGLLPGDLGYMDQEGRYYVVSRTDDMIMQGGSRAYPIDIEEVLLKNEQVKEAVVFGVDDEKLGQRIIAVACRKPGSEIKVKDLYQWCVAKLEDRKVPKEIYIVDHIPRNTIGKIAKNDIQELYRQLTLPREAVQ